MVGMIKCGGKDLVSGEYMFYGAVEGKIGIKFNNFIVPNTVCFHIVVGGGGY